MSDEESVKAPKKKPFFDENIVCKHCGKGNHVQAFRKTLTAAVPAEVEIEVTVTASDSRLEEFDEK